MLSKPAFKVTQPIENSSPILVIFRATAFRALSCERARATAEYVCSLFWGEVVDR